MRYRPRLPRQLGGRAQPARTQVVDQAEQRLAVLEVLEEERLPHNAARIGDHLKAGLGELQARYPVIGDMLETGMRYGLIRFGSRVDIYFPKGSDVQIRLGEKTVAGETILGTLP